jgi:REP-associated tyrosine transposase
MQRPRSLIIGAGATYHVGTRGVRRSPIFYDDFDRAWFFEDLTKIVRDLGWRCHAYCLMTNHYHLLVRTPEPDLSVGMWRLNQRHALRINRRHGFGGHVFEGRFFAELIEDDPYFVGVARYIDQNPVRAGICKSPEAWPWSGCAATLGLRRRLSFFDPSDLLAYYSSDAGRARTMYALSLQDFSPPTRTDASRVLDLGQRPFSRSRTSPRSVRQAGGQAVRPGGRRR